MPTTFKYMKKSKIFSGGHRSFFFMAAFFLNLLNAESLIFKICQLHVVMAPAPPK
jgi:hypothetical protein